MTKFMKLKQAAAETGISEYTLRQYCKQGKIRYNIAGRTNYILCIEWLEEDLRKMALENMGLKNEGILEYGRLRKIER